jgi:Zn-dependent peptidase ImmA (M78 family)
MVVKKLDNHKEIIQEFLNDGLSSREISRRLNVNVTTITRYIQKHNLAVRTNYSIRPIDDVIQSLITEYELTVPVDLEGICSKMDIKIKVLDFDDDLSGMITNRTIYINKNNHKNRQRFTLAHELGHFLLHKKQDNSYKGVRFRSEHISSKEKIEEREANHFASLILMPTKFIKEELEGLKELSEDFIFDLAKKYKVSSIAMTIRLEKLGYCFN